MAFNFATNGELKNTVQISLLALALPDVILCLVYWPFHFANLMRGEAISEGSCRVVAFLTYGIVVATFCGPATVGAVTHSVFAGIAQGSMVSKQLSVRTIKFLIAAPWILGFIIASVIDSIDNPDTPTVGDGELL